MGNYVLSKDVLLEHNEQHVHLEFSHPRQVLSSAVLNGGLKIAHHILNLKVSKIRQDNSALESPETTLDKYCIRNNWKGATIGMMTAASLKSLRIVRETVQGVEIIAIVTSGLSNPRCAGDYAECRELAPKKKKTGTINTILLTEASLAESALVEAALIATEAKVVALHNMGIKSTVSKYPATGTGTDSLCVINGDSDIQVDYCGKHTIFGEKLACVIIDATSASISWAIRNTSSNTTGCGIRIFP